MKELPTGLVSSRRRALAAFGGALTLTGAARAVDNVYLGYGTIEGTNLLAQDLDSYASERFGVRASTVDLGAYQLTIDTGEVIATEQRGSKRATATPGVTNTERAAQIDADLGLEDGPFEELVADLDAIDRGAFEFEFLGLEAFFERGQTGRVRPYTVAAIRGPAYERADPTLVAELADTDPSDTPALATGLATGLRHHSEYDVQRYLAGAVEDNVLQGTVELRSSFQSPHDLEAIAAGTNDGLFCTEIAHATIEAFHAVAPPRQSVPVACAHIADRRHKHAYTGLATVLREDDKLIVPMTFADYMNPLLHDTLYARWLLGDQLDAYDDGHRTSNIYWNEYAGIA
jgi:hypothetical protein